MLCNDILAVPILRKMYCSNIILLVSLILLIGLAGKTDCQEKEAEPLTCFKCSTVGNDGDMTCLESPESLNNNGKVVCPSTYHCTLVRTEFTDIPGRVVSLVRDCQLNPLIRNDVKTDAHYTKFYRACQEDSCNKGDGITALGPNGGSGQVGEPIQVSAKSSSNPGIVCSSSRFSLMLTLTLLLSLTVRIFL